MKLDLIQPDVIYRRLQERDRSLLDSNHDNRALQSEMIQVKGYSYDLTLKDKESIGKVTSEVSAYVEIIYDGATLSLGYCHQHISLRNKFQTGSSIEFRSTTLKEWCRPRCCVSS